MIFKHITTRRLGLLPFFVALLANAQAQDSKLLPGYFTAAVYRPADGKLYAAGYTGDIFGTPTGDPFVAVIDPNFSRIEQTIPIGGYIGNMALTSDEAYLYCATYDSIFRYNFATSAIDLRFASQIGAPNSNYFTDLATVPGQPNLLVVSWNLNFGSAENALVVYDNGLRKPDVVQDFYNYQSLALADDGVHLYTYNRSTTASEISRLEITPNGVSLLAETYFYVREFSDFIRYFDGRIYGSEGTVAAIDGDNDLRLAGRLDTRINGGRPKTKVLRHAPGGDTIFLHASSGGNVFLQKFDRDNFQLLEMNRIGKAPIESGINEVYPLEGLRSVAVRHDNNRLSIIRNCSSQIAGVEDFPKPVDYGCVSDTLRITAPGNYPDDHYFWSDGTRGKTYKRYLPDQTPFSLSYRVADANGCLSPSSKPLEIRTVYPWPALGMGSSSNVICAGGFVELTAIPPGAQSLQGIDVVWSDGQIGERVRIETPGSYTCRARSPEGCLGAIQQWPIVVTATGTPQPAQPSIIVEAGNGDAIICSSEAGQLKATAGFPVYIWSDGLTSVTNQRSLPAEGPISVQVRNTLGCTSEYSESLDIQRYSTPPKPSIVRAENVLGSSAPLGNQWFLNGVAIPGATGQFLQATQPGSYTVQVTLDVGCPSLLSEPFVF
jgi:hypothetical protein